MLMVAKIFWLVLLSPKQEVTIYGLQNQVKLFFLLIYSLKNKGIQKYSK